MHQAPVILPVFLNLTLTWDVFKYKLKLGEVLDYIGDLTLTWDVFK